MAGRLQWTAPRRPMARVTLREDSDDTILVTMEFDPPLDRFGENPPLSHMLAVAATDSITKGLGV